MWRLVLTLIGHLAPCRARKRCQTHSAVAKKPLAVVWVERRSRFDARAPAQQLGVGVSAQTRNFPASTSHASRRERIDPRVGVAPSPGFPRDDAQSDGSVPAAAHSSTTAAAPPMLLLRCRRPPAEPGADAMPTRGGITEDDVCHERQADSVMGSRSSVQ